MTIVLAAAGDKYVYAAYGVFLAIVLIYVAARISYDLGGTIAVVIALTVFAAIEACLFWTTRFRSGSES